MVKKKSFEMIGDNFYETDSVDNNSVASSHASKGFEMLNKPKETNSNQLSLTTDDFEFLEKLSNSSKSLDDTKKSKKTKSKILIEDIQAESTTSSGKVKKSSKSKDSGNESIKKEKKKSSKKKTKEEGSAPASINIYSYYDEEDGDELKIKKDIDYEEL